MKNIDKLSLVALFVFFILFILAFFNDWEYDEAWTYNGSSSNNILDLLLYTKYKYANHQILNSLYFKLLQNFNINNVIYYRLMSLLSFLIFFYANANILKSLNVNGYLVLFIVISPYSIYFTLGRGYGLALGLFSLSLMYLINYRNEKNILTGYLFVISGILSILSIFSFLYAFAALILIYLYYNKAKLMSYHIIIQLSIVALTFLYVYYAGKIINSFDPYIIGSESVFKNGTISSIISSFTSYTRLKNMQYYFVLKIIFIFCLSLPFFFVLLRKNSRQYFLKSSLPFMFIIFLSLIFMIISNLLFDAKYPLGRAVMFIQYLVLLLIAISSKYYIKRIYYLPLVLILAFSVFNNSYHFTNLFKPSLKTILKTTNGYPLFITGHNPNVKLVNKIYDIKEDSCINQSRHIQVINKLIKNTNTKCFVLTTENAINSINYSNKEYKLCRDGLILIELGKTPTNNTLYK